MKKVVLFVFVLVFLSTTVIVRFISPVVSYPEEIKLLKEVDPPVHNINTGLDYATIQEAIDANETLHGHTILVDAGIYYEQVVVNKSLILMGEDRGTIIDGNMSGVVVQVEAENVTIEEFTIRNGGDIYSGIEVFSSENNVVDNNITNCWCGIRLENTSHNIMVNNSITNNLNGISGELCSENTVVGNSIRDNYLGIWMGHYSMRNILTFNDIRNHWAEGISMWESHQNIIAGNNILANNHGGHWTAIVLGDSSYNSIFHNNIVNKGKQIDVNRTNIWDEEYPSGGNYWSDYSGSDLYSGPYQNKTGSDGIGDTPYVIDADNEDKYPLIDPYPLPDMQRIYNEFYKLLADFIELQSEYDELQSSYRDLAGRYNSLEAQLNRLQSEYTGLQSKYDSLRNELNITRSIMYALLITTIVFIAITVYIVIRKPKVKPELEIA